MEKQLQAIIEAFEAEQISVHDAIDQIFSISGKEVDKYLLFNYWQTEDLEDLCKRLALQPIQDWKEIDYKRAKEMIEEVLENIIDDAIIEQNCEALGKRYSKPSGKVLEIITQDDLNIDQMVDKLKENTTFYL